jgi:hypothetical protein
MEGGGNRVIKFEFKGIKIAAMVEMERYDYRDANNHARTRFDRKVLVTADFWNFHIVNDLYDLAFVKATLNYFMQAYWKRSSKEGSRIDLATALDHGSDCPPYGFMQSLNLIARQKNKKHFLEVSLFENGHPAGEIYLGGQEVIMLDIALGKSINLLTPEAVYHEPLQFG